jgi:hypothetical protein
VKSGSTTLSISSIRVPEADLAIDARVGGTRQGQPAQASLLRLRPYRLDDAPLHSCPSSCFRARRLCCNKKVMAGRLAS